MSLLPDAFCKIEKVSQYQNKQGDYSIPTWINDKCGKTYYFPTRYAAKQFRKTHEIINGIVMEIKN